MEQPILNNQQKETPWFVMGVVLSVIEMLMCNMLTGAISLVLVLLSDSDYKQGNIEAAESKKKWAIITTIIGVVLSIIISIVILILFFSGLGYIAVNFQ